MSLSLTRNTYCRTLTHTLCHNMQAVYREHNTNNIETHAADTHFQSAKLPVTNPGQCQVTNKRSCYNTCTDIHTHRHTGTTHTRTQHCLNRPQAGGRRRMMITFIAKQILCRQTWAQPLLCPQINLSVRVCTCLHRCDLHRPGWRWGLRGGICNFEHSNNASFH